MAETLGSLCDKLTIVKLKQWHTENQERLASLDIQESQLKTEIDEFVNAAMAGEIPVERLTFAANKVYKPEGNQVENIAGNIGEVFAKLAEINCQLWHEQEKVYEFETVPPAEKDVVVKQLAILNLARNKCIDGINSTFQQAVVKRQTALLSDVK